MKLIEIYKRTSEGDLIPIFVLVPDNVSIQATDEENQVSPEVFDASIKGSSDFLVVVDDAFSDDVPSALNI